LDIGVNNIPNHLVMQKAGILRNIGCNESSLKYSPENKNFELGENE